MGYPPRDLLEKPALMRQVQEALDHLVDLSARYPDTGILVGAPQPTGRDTGKGLCNCAVLIHQGEVRLRQAKSLLPTYDVFDETRHFEPAGEVRSAPLKTKSWGSPSAKTPGTIRSCGSGGSIPWTPSRSRPTRAPRC